MSDKRVFEMFTNDQQWLADQPEMDPWDEGCQRLAVILDERLADYSANVCSDVIAKERNEWPLYLGRLWQCLGYHWQHAIEGSCNGQTTASGVVARLQKGKGYRRGGKLGGDPLRDMVLAVAMVQKDERAPVVFTEDYQGFAKGLAWKINRRLTANPDEWWYDLLDHLAGYSKPKARLDRFLGRCGLQNWLGTVVWNFLRRWDLPDGGSDGPPIDIPDPPSPKTDGESLEHFKAIVRLAIESLRKKDRLLLALVYVDRLQQNEAAAVLGVHPGQVSRRLKKVLDHLEKTIKELAEERLSKDACVGIFEDLRDNPQAFAEILRAAIEQGREHES